LLTVTVPAGEQFSSLRQIETKPSPMATPLPPVPAFGYGSSGRFRRCGVAGRARVTRRCGGEVAGGRGAAAARRRRSGQRDGPSSHYIGVTNCCDDVTYAAMMASIHRGMDGKEVA